MTEVNQPDPETQEATQPPEKQREPETVVPVPATDPQVLANIKNPRDETARQASSVLDKQQKPKKLPHQINAGERFKDYIESEGSNYALPFGLLEALEMVSKEPQPMSAAKALETLKKHLGYDAGEKEIKRRFPYLDGFRGEIYIDTTSRNHKTYVYVTGEENGETRFRLECKIFSYDGICPIARIDEHDSPKLPEMLRDKLKRDREETKKTYEYYFEKGELPSQKIINVHGPLKMLINNPRPMNTEEALELLTNSLEGKHGRSKEVVAKNFPDLNGFKGEIYMGGETTKDIGDGIIEFYIIGAENGETKFKLIYRVTGYREVFLRRRNDVDVIPLVRIV